MPALATPRKLIPSLERSEASLPSLFHWAVIFAWHGYRALMLSRWRTQSRQSSILSLHRWS